MMGFFEDHQGNKSMMRLLAFIAAVLSGILILSAVAMGFIVIYGDSVPPGAMNMATVFATTGMGAISLSEWFKERQARHERGL